MLYCGILVSVYQLLKFIDIQVYQRLHESSMSQDLIIVRLKQDFRGKLQYYNMDILQAFFVVLCRGLQYQIISHFFSFIIIGRKVFI